MDLSVVALPVVAAVLAASLAVLFFRALFGDRRRRCSRCTAALGKGASECPVCARPVRPVAAHPGGAPYGYGEAVAKDRSRPGRHDPEVGYLNRGITRRMVKVATLGMAGGLAVRVVGMLPGLGVHVVVPTALMVGLTIVGGVVAFIGFVVLDAA